MNSILALALLASGAFAAPGTEYRRASNADKIARRSSGSSMRQSNPRILVSTPPTVQGGGDIDAHYYSSNWAGAAKSESGFTYVTADTVVPVPSEPSGGSSRTAYYASAWVGLDGYECASAILQTGIDVGVEGSETAYSAWYEWYPDYAYDFDIDISAGDSIRMTVDATSKTAGTATIENLTTGASVTHTFNGEGDTLCETDAEWIVERFSQVSSNGDVSLVPFADFGSFTFTGCEATEDGETVGLDGADIIDIVDEDDNVVTECTIESDTELYCEYTG